MHLTSHTPKLFLCSLLFLSILAIRCCTTQGYYYNGYNPYRTDPYSRAIAAANQRNAYYNNNNYNSYSSPRASTNDRRAYKRSQTQTAGHNRVSKADAENAKFAGVGNFEDDDESSKTLLHLKKKLLKKKLRQKLRPRPRPFSPRRCYPYGRNSQLTNTTPAPREQGRFLWDVSVTNVYADGGYQTPLLSDCPGVASDYYGGYGSGYGFGGFGGGLAGLAGSLLSDPVEAAYPTLSPFNNFLNLFAPGILQNALAVTERPRPPPPPPPPSQTQSDSTGAANDELDDLQSDPAVDPTYRPPVIPQRRPNRVYYDSSGGAALTPAQLVGGVSTTVNGIIQQLTGNVQPVYQGTYRRSASYG